MEVRGANLIGYQFSQKGETTFRAFDPVRNIELPTIFHQATQPEVDSAIQLADRAFPSWSSQSPDCRRTFLHAIADRLEQDAGTLCRLFCMETGLPEERALSELKRTCFQLRTYSDAACSGKVLNATIETGDHRRQPIPKPDLRKINVALGPVVVFGASNFPFAYSTAGGDTASALAAGCTVIVKGHPMHPHTGERTAMHIMETARKLGLPEGVFSYLHARDFEAGKQLVLDQRIKAVGFTGSVEGGMALHRLSQSRPEPIPVFAEMGSLNPVVILPDALVHSGESIAQKLVHSISDNAGQFCTKPGLLFLLQGDQTERWLTTLAGKLEEVQAMPMLHPGIYERYKTSRAEQLSGTEMLVAGEIDHPNYVRPALLRISGTAFLAEPVRRKEVFGPFSMVVVCSTADELGNCLRTIEGNLTGSLFVSDSEADQANWLIPLLQSKSGRVILNGVPTGVEVSPAMHHGGPFPASTDSRFTSVGCDAILRFMRPVSYQNFPDQLLPEALQQDNPYGILRFVNGSWEV